MPETDHNLTTLFVTSALVILLLVLLIILFVVVHQRKVLQDQDRLRSVKAVHQQALLEASVEAREATLKRIARELHDELGALLSTTKLHVTQFGSKHPELNGVQAHTETVKEMLTDGLGSVRRIVNEMLPPTLRDFGLQAALNELITRVNEAGELQVQVHYSWLEPRLDPSHELPLFRIAQELINNTLKHAQAKTANLDLLREPDAVVLEYRDDGRGFDPKQVDRSLGLQNLESRAEVLGGSFEFSSQPGGGFRALITLPIPKKS